MTVPAKLKVLQELHERGLQLQEAQPGSMHNEKAAWKERVDVALTSIFDYGSTPYRLVLKLRRVRGYPISTNLEALKTAISIIESGDPLGELNRDSSLQP